MLGEEVRMYSFKTDYSEGAHPRILNALMESNDIQEEGYGQDQFSQKAIELLKERMGNTNVEIHLLAGGTQTNLTALSAFLRPHEAVIAASSGHIATHETGAIEATGHKVITIDRADGKLDPTSVKEVLDVHLDEHMVKPKLVYISNTTEMGTIYKKSELQNLNDFCREHQLLLYMDGARLGSALCSKQNDLDLKDLPALVDAFYIGGTKNGALIGEALVICNDTLKEDFRFHMKQKGALLAKGRLIGIQFLELFKDHLFFDLAAHANEMAGVLREELHKAEITFLTHSPSNQLFPILPNSIINKLKQDYSFHIWEQIDEEHSAIRLVTSWATKEEEVFSFIDFVQREMKKRG